MQLEGFLGQLAAKLRDLAQTAFSRLAGTRRRVAFWPKVK